MQDRHRLLRAYWLLLAVTGLVLFAVTWRLWTPQDLFPRIPAFGFLVTAPDWMDWPAFGGCLLGLGVIAWTALSGRGGIAGPVLFAVSVLAAAALDQHRLQPWAWHFCLLSVLLAGVSDDKAWTWIRWLTISIYVHSAWSKLDAAFLNAHGQLLLDGALEAVGLSIRFWSPSARFWTPLLFPVVELAVGLLLIPARTRKAALLASLAMHAGLLLILGPLGLDHEPGVLLWNVFFILQNLLLLAVLRSSGRTEAGEPQPDVPPAPDRRSIAAVLTRTALVAAMLLPFSRPWGLWDPWPSWHVYSTRPTLAHVFVRWDLVDDLPAGARPYALETEDHLDYRRLNVDAWSFATLDCPIYPGLRYRIAVAGAIRNQLPDQDDALRIELRVWEGPRKSERTSEILTDGQFAALRDSFWLNTTPRSQP